MGSIVTRRICGAACAALVVPAVVVAIGLPASGGITEAHAATTTLTKVKKVHVSNVKTTSFKVAWTGKTKASKTKGYQVRVYHSGKVVKRYTIKDRRIHSKYVKGLKPGTSYRVKVRAYKSTVHRYGKWSTPKSVRTLKTMVSSTSFFDAFGDVKYTVKGTKVVPYGYGHGDSYVDGGALIVRYQAKNVSDEDQMVYPDELRAYQQGVKLDHAGYVDGLGSSTIETIEPGASIDGWIAFDLRDLHSAVTLKAYKSYSSNALAFKKTIDIA